MHPYSINSCTEKNARTEIGIRLFVISVLLSMVLNRIFSPLLESFGGFLKANNLSYIAQFAELINFSPDIFGTAFIYAVLAYVFNQVLWRNKIIMRYHGVPNLNGTWTGELISSFDNKKIPMSMYIEQNWNSISIKSEFCDTKSYSYSNTATVKYYDSRTSCLYFAYHNQSADVSTGLQEYDGYNILVFNHCDNTVIAKYFNDRPNPDPNIKGGNKGVFTLQKVL